MGDKVFSQGDTEISLQVVAQGCIRLERTITPNETARLALIGEGETVDELSFMSGLPTTAHAVAVEDTDIVELSSEDFSAITKRHATICPTIIRTLARQLRENKEKVDSLLSLDASARLAREIIRFVPTNDPKVLVEVTLPYSQEELAHRIGTRRETVNRCLKELRHDGVLVDLARNRYRVDVPNIYRTAGIMVVRSAGK